jgi:very-short-patch-repair endonuclease
LAPIAASAPWVLSTGELLALGLSKEQIAQRVRMGLLFRLHRGVYAVGRPQVGFEGRCRAAWLACGPGSAISHDSAAAEWGWRRSGGAVHVSVPRGRKGHPGLVIHRPRSLSSADVVQREGFAVTSVARTLLDMSVGQSVDTVGGWIHEAEVQGMLDLREVWAVLERLPQHRGRGVLEAALALEVLPARTGLERLMISLWRRAGLGTPRVNEHVWSGDRLEEVDLHDPDLRLIAEADGARYHGSRWRRRRDAAKDARLRASGWIVGRYPELQMTLEPQTVVADLRRLATLGRSNAS